jgi:serine/threonine protein kinase
VFRPMSCSPMLVAIRAGYWRASSRLASWRNRMRLEDRYAVVRELGKGGFGRVLLVRDRKAGTQHAAKVLMSPNDPHARKQFRREVRLLSFFQRFRRVVRIEVAHLNAEPPFFVMPYAEDGAITRWCGKLDLQQTLTVMKQLMEAVTQIHAHGGFHRDIKPDNILVFNRMPALADFGLGNSPDCTVHLTMNAYGTPGYAAPELFQVQPFSTAADVFSAGATWFHLITGQRPSPGSVELDPRNVKPKTPAWIANLIIRMTARDVARRPSAAAVFHAVQSHNAVEKPLPWRHEGLVAALGLAALVLFGLRTR